MAIDKRRNPAIKCLTCKIYRLKNDFKNQNCCNTCFQKRISLHIKFKKVDPTKTNVACPKCNTTNKLCDMRYKGFQTMRGVKYFQGFVPYSCIACYTKNRYDNTLKQLNDPLTKDSFILARRLRERKNDKRRNGSMLKAFRRGKSTAKSQGVKWLITLPQFESLFKNPYDFYDGKRLTFGKSAYRLDRIGKTQFGGDGKRGGDYHIDNVVICHFKHNFSRDKMDLSVADYKKLIVGYLKFKKQKKANKNYIKYMRLKNNLKIRSSI